MKIAFINKYTPIDPKEFELFEQRTGYKLPDSYKQFLLEQNGASLEDFNIDKVSGKTINYGIKFCFYNETPVYIRVESLFPFEPFDNGNYHFIADKEEGFNRAEYGNYSEGHLVIGDSSDFGVGILTLNLSKEDYGAIYRFSNDLDYSNPEYNVIRVSNSFEEMLESFEEIPEDY